MRKEIIETGKSVDAAIEAACEKLGCDRDKCEWEIIDLPKKTFLGLKTVPARVKVSVDIPDEKPAEQKPRRTPPPAPKREQKPRQDIPPQQEPRRSEAVVKPAPTPVAAPAPVQSQPAPQQSDYTPEQDAPRVRVTEGFTEKETAAMQYVMGILKEFGLNAGMELSREGSAVCIDVVGDGLGAIIGRRGETLDAIQYLTGLVANRLEGDYIRVTVDCGDYRNKRKDTLEALAKKLAAQVLKTNTSKTLEPMNPFERRVIHATVSKIEGVSSSSIGEEPNRRVVITTPTARRPAPRSGGYGRPGGPGRDRDGGDRKPRPGGGRDRDRRDDRRRSSRGPRPSQAGTTAPSGPPKETPESAVVGNAPIGKLDLE